MDKNGRKGIIFCVDVENSNQKEKGKVGHLLQIGVCRSL